MPALDAAATRGPALRALARRVRSAEPRCGEVRVVCIDGPAGSGKTTLAAALAEVLDAAPVVHLDDLYDGWAQPLGPPLAARLRDWLLDPWRAGLVGRYPHYDWAAGGYDGWVEVAAAPVVVLEGCGSAARGVRERASLVLWVEAAADVRLTRGLARDGAALEPQWLEWQRREALHFTTDATREAADVIVTT